MEWLNTLDPDSLTYIMLQRCTREELHCLLYLAIGLRPTDKIPRPLRIN